MLYYPWFDEQVANTQPMRSTIDVSVTNESKYTKDDIEVDEDGPPERLWNSIAPSTKVE